MQSANRLPPGPQFTAFGLLRFVTGRPRMLRENAQKYGTSFTIRVPGFGTTVVLTELESFRELFRISAEIAGGVELSLDVMFGEGSSFGMLTGEHRCHRRVLTPPLHGRTMRAFESLIDEETRKEIASWPVGEHFSTVTSTNRIALNNILRVGLAARRGALVFDGDPWQRVDTPNAPRVPALGVAE